MVCIVEEILGPKKENQLWLKTVIFDKINTKQLQKKTNGESFLLSSQIIEERKIIVQNVVITFFHEQITLICDVLCIQKGSN